MPIRVLIADDNKDFSDLLGDIIQIYSDIEIVGIAKNGIETLNLVKLKKPDVLLLDIVMPNIDGIEVLRNLIKLNADMKPVVFILSALGNEEVTRRAVSLGARFLFTKPVDLEYLISKIREVTGKEENNPTIIQDDLNLGIKTMKPLRLDK